MSGRATLATARLRLATPATRISVARTSPARLGPLDSTAALELDPGAGRAEVADRRRADLALAAPGLVDVAADRQPRPLLLDRPQQRRAAEFGAVGAGVAVAAWAASGGPARRPRGRRASIAARRLVVEVEAPFPGRDRDAGAEAEELDPVDRRPLAVQDRGRAPSRAAAARRASTVSLLPGTSTVGVAIAARAAIVSSRPSWTEAKSPAPITTSASADISTSFAPCSRSRCRSLKASSFTLETYPLRSARRTRRTARAPGLRRAFPAPRGLQVEVEQRLADRHVGDQQGEDQRPEQVDQQERQRREDQPEGQDRPGDEEQRDEEDDDPDRVPPAPADQLGAAAEGLPQRLVGEQHFLPDEGPADQLPDREGEADRS